MITMIVLDIESTGLNVKESAILSIGALEFENPKNQFYDEGRAFDGAMIDKEALEVNGFSERDCFDQKRKSQKDMILNFYDWLREIKGDYILLGQNVFFDREIINKAFEREGINFRFHFRVIELHSVAMFDRIKKGKKIPISKRRSAFGLDAILNYTGLPEEPRPHNALVGAKMEAEAFSRIFYGKNLLEEFSQYKIPEHFCNI